MMRNCAKRLRQILLLTLLVLVAIGLPMGVVAQHVVPLSIVPGTSIGANIWVGGPSQNLCGSAYSSRAPISVYFNVSQWTQWVRIWDFVPMVPSWSLQADSLKPPQIVPPNQTVHALSGYVIGYGFETIVLQALTASGQIVTAGCTFFVGELVITVTGPGGEPMPMSMSLDIVPEPPPGSPGGAIGVLQIGLTPTYGGCVGDYRIGHGTTSWNMRVNTYCSMNVTH